MKKSEKTLINNRDSKILELESKKNIVIEDQIIGRLEKKGNYKNEKSLINKNEDLHDKHQPELASPPPPSEIYSNQYGDVLFGTIENDQIYIIGDSEEYHKSDDADTFSFVGDTHGNTSAMDFVQGEDFIQLYEVYNFDNIAISQSANGTLIESNISDISDFLDGFFSILTEEDFIS